MTTADFIDVGTSLDLSEALMMSVTVGSSSFLASLIIQVGIRSNVQLFEGDLLMILHTSSCVVVYRKLRVEGGLSWEYVQVDVRAIR